MTHCLPIFTAGSSATWWNNFMDYVQIERYGVPTVNESLGDWIKYRNEEFAKWGAWFDGVNLIFTDKDTAAIFVLRWS